MAQLPPDSTSNVPTTSATFSEYYQSFSQYKKSIIHSMIALVAWFILFCCFFAIQSSYHRWIITRRAERNDIEARRDSSLLPVTTSAQSSTGLDSSPSVLVHGNAALVGHAQPPQSPSLSWALNVRSTLPPTGAINPKPAMRYALRQAAPFSPAQDSQIALGTPVPAYSSAGPAAGGIDIDDQSPSYEELIVFGHAGNGRLSRSERRV